MLSHRCRENLKCNIANEGRNLLRCRDDQPLFRLFAWSIQNFAIKDCRRRAYLPNTGQIRPSLLRVQEKNRDQQVKARAQCRCCGGEHRVTGIRRVHWRLGNAFVYDGAAILRHAHGAGSDALCAHKAGRRPTLLCGFQLTGMGRGSRSREGSVGSSGARIYCFGVTH
jgi:hypothetical protein